MTEVNLLARYPRAKRNIKSRLGNKEENRVIAMQFGKEYFGGDEFFVFFVFRLGYACKWTSSGVAKIGNGPKLG